MKWAEPAVGERMKGVDRRGCVRSGWFPSDEEEGNERALKLVS